MPGLCCHYCVASLRVDCGMAALRVDCGMAALRVDCGIMLWLDLVFWLQGKGEFTMEYSHHAAVGADVQAQLTSDFRGGRKQQAATA